MARREEFITVVHCPKCKKNGSVIWEENENPVHHGGNLNQKPKRASAGFRILMDDKIVCASCAREAVQGKIKDAVD